jgi:purine nucleosidase
MKTSEAIILDTDIGSDIDDAVALAYLLKQPRCELLGVTTVTGDVQQRAALAEIVCRAAGREDVPIHCGARDVLYHGPGQPSVPQYDAVRDRPHRLDRPEDSAVDFLRETIRRRPGEVTLVSIGPLTNVALLSAVDPQAFSMLKGVVSMVGWFFPPEPARREWNAFVDPIATAMMYRRCRRNHLSVGLDVTLQCTMSAEEVRRRFVAPPLNIVGEMAEVWFRGRNTIVFHDPLAAALLFRPSVCQYQAGEVIVSVHEKQEESGHTRFVPAEDGPHRVARSVGSAGFFEEFFSVFG